MRINGRRRLRVADHPYTTTILFSLGLLFLSCLPTVGAREQTAIADSIATRIGSMGTATPNGSTAITNDGKYVYVTTPVDLIKKFDMVTGALVASIAAFNAGGLTLSPDGTTLFATSASTGEVNHPIDQLLKISTVTDQIVTTYTPSSWPTGSGLYFSGYPLMSPDGTRVLAPYWTGSKVLLASIDLATDAVTPIDLPAEASTAGCCLFIMDSVGESMYFTWQQSGYKNFISQMNLETGDITWNRQLPYNALPRGVVEGADGYRYVLGTNVYYEVAYLFRYDISTGDRDTHFTVDVNASPNDNLFLVDGDWGLRFYTKTVYVGEFGYQRKTTMHHVHFSNLQRTYTQVLDTEGEAYGFSVNGSLSAFYNYDGGTWSGSIYTVQLEDDTQTLTVPSISEQTLGVGTPTLTGSASSGLALTFSSITPTTCSTDGSSVTGLAVGTCTIRASQAGGKGWKAASADVSFAFRKPVITWMSLTNDVKRSSSRVVSATSDSGLPITFTSETPTVCTVTGSRISYVSAGECSVVASQGASGSIPAADDVRRQFTIFPSSVSSETGISIDEGSPYTNDAKVVLSIAWPDYVTGVRISNDGGFLPSKTSSFDVKDEITWILDSSVKGSFTKVVYIKFTGPGADPSRVYSDDIILDTTAPTLTSVVGVSEQPSESSVSVAALRAKPRSAGARLTVRAKDALSGIGQVQLKSSSRGRITTVKTSNPKATSRNIRIKTTKSLVYVRVVDRAGNPSRWLTVRVK